MYNIHTIAEKINPIKVVLHHEDPEIEHFLTDSRSLLRPEHTLFSRFAPLPAMDTAISKSSTTTAFATSWSLVMHIFCLV